MVDDEEGGRKQEMVYEVTSGAEKRDGSIETNEREETDGKDREAESGEAGDRGQQEKAEGLGHTAEEKCRAVLSVWTERRKPGRYAGSWEWLGVY